MFGRSALFGRRFDGFRENFRSRRRFTLVDGHNVWSFCIWSFPRLFGAPGDAFRRRHGEACVQEVPPLVG